MPRPKLVNFHPSVFTQGHFVRTSVCGRFTIDLEQKKNGAVYLIFKDNKQVTVRHSLEDSLATVYLLA